MTLKEKIFLLTAAVLIIMITASLFGHRITKEEYTCKGCNLVLVTFDSLRADHLTANGYTRNTTPNIRKLALNGLNFRNLIANSDLTFRALPALMSSKYPRLTNIDFAYSDPEIGKELSFFVLDDKDNAMAEILEQNGYYTAAFFSIPLLNKTNIGKGFNDIFQFDVPDAYTDSLLASMAEKIMSNGIRTPFFLWIHFSSPHYPYELSEPWNSTFQDDDLYKKSSMMVIDRNMFTMKSERTDIDYLTSQYDAEVKYGDYLLGKIVESIGANGFENNTLVAISSDHGEFLGEHSSFGHNLGLYDEELKIPLVFYNPKARKNATFSDQIEQIDIYPTMMDILEIKNPKGLQGRSFYGLITDGEYIERTARIIKKEKMMAFRTHKWKFIINEVNATNELFDLENDPNEKINLISQYPDYRLKIPYEMQYLVEAGQDK